MTEEDTKEFAGNYLERHGVTQKKKKKTSFFDRFRERPEVREARTSAYRKQELKEAKIEGRRMAIKERKKREKKRDKPGTFWGTGGFTGYARSVSSGNPFTSSSIFSTEKKEKKKKKKGKTITIRMG